MQVYHNYMQKSTSTTKILIEKEEPMCEMVCNTDIREVAIRLHVLQIADRLGVTDSTFPKAPERA